LLPESVNPEGMATTDIAAKLGALARTAASAHFGQQRIEHISLLPFGGPAASYT
jgi:hypothetical protein